MSFKDRTPELFNIVQSLKQRQHHAMAAHKQNVARVRRTEFNRIAKSIQQDINNTFTKLEKLALRMCMVASLLSSHLDILFVLFRLPFFLYLCFARSITDKKNLCLYNAGSLPPLRIRSVCFYHLSSRRSCRN